MFRALLHATIDRMRRAFVSLLAGLPVGGVDDKVWRSALRLSLSSVPLGAEVASVELPAYHDGVCVAPRRTSVACPARPYTPSAHQIFATDGGRREEPEIDESPIVESYLEDAPSPQGLSWDVTAPCASGTPGSLRTAAPSSSSRSTTRTSASAARTSRRRAIRTLGCGRGWS